MIYIFQRLKRFCAFVTGFVFFTSGILKLVDPVGAGLVMDEYFSFLHIGFLGFASKFIGTALAFTETVLGAAIITGIWRRSTALAAFIFQGFFTLLTLILVIFNPEMDCGCFGEAIHLTHLQTFLKNIVLCILLIVAYIPFKDPGEPKKIKYVSFSIIVLSISAFTIYSWMYIPMKDFTEYRAGAVLNAARAYIPEEDLYEAVFVYEKDGKQESFSLEHLPDSTWTFVKTETILKDGAQENGINLSIFDSENNYCDALAAEGKVMVISVYDRNTDIRKWKKIASDTEKAVEAGFDTIILSASAPEQIDSVLDNIDPKDAETIKSHLYFSDYKTLITLNRSNGGCTYFYNGELICKWASRSFPDLDSLKRTSEDSATEAYLERSTHKGLAFQGFLLYVTAVMLLL